MSDKPNETAAVKAPARKTAAEQAAEQSAAQGPLPVRDGDRKVEQTIVQTITVPVKAGQTISDAVKDWLVSQGGFEGKGIAPGPSGAIMEREVREGQQEHLDHPAIDGNPRRGLPESALQRDMNDPRFDRTDTSQGLVEPKGPVE